MATNTTNTGTQRQHNMRNTVTLVLWAIALSSHLFLLPKFIKDMRSHSS